MNLETISASLTTLGVAHSALPSGTDGAILVLPEYGRVLGVWPHWRAENALWVNPSFLELLRIGVKDDGWLNPGGDRIWLAPEEEFFPESGSVPAAIDPGRYQRISSRIGFAMENRGETRAWRAGLRVRFRLVRHVHALDEPELTALCGETWLRRAGYSEETTLEIEGERPGAVWLWNLTHVSAGAELRIPVPSPDGGVGIVRTLGVAGGPRIGLPVAESGSPLLCIQQREQGRAQLIVKRFEHDRGEGRSGPLVTYRGSDGGDAGEFSCSSGSVPVRGNKLRWKTALCAFSGRNDEIQTFAARILG